MPDPRLPGGVVTFLLTDIVGSTALWERKPEAMEQVLERHDELVAGVVRDHDGALVKSKGEGDSTLSAFAFATDAVAAALFLHRAIASETWPAGVSLGVRTGLHTGEAQVRSGDYFGTTVNRAARIRGLARGGEILLSGASAELLIGRLPDGARLIDRGEHSVKGLDRPEHVFALAHPDLADLGPPPGEPQLPPSTLPVQRTALIGREALTTKLRDRLRTARLVTLTGIGGAGKTSAAIDAATRARSDFADGVFFIDLARVGVGDDVAAAFLGGLSAAAPPDRTALEHIHAHLSDLDALLVVDNCEHVLDAAADVLDGVLDVATRVRVLATSREPLELDGEHVVRIPPLAVDGPDSAAVRLFIERATAAGGTLVSDDIGLDAAERICRRLDGIPLAIELAAARVRTLSPVEVLQRLDDRFRLLVGGRRTAARRQQTLEAAIEWSYELLDPTEQAVFRTLSVCAGGFTLATAARLLELDDLTAAEQIDALVAKCLVTPMQGEGDAHGFRMLETVREYGRRRLADAHALEDAFGRLSRALLPPPTHLDHWQTVALEVLEWSDSFFLEASTTFAVASDRLQRGHLDDACFLLGRSLVPGDPTALEMVGRHATALAARREELSKCAWLAASYVEVFHHVLAYRYLDALAVATEVAEQLAPDDPGRHSFEWWRGALTSAVDVRAALDHLDGTAARVAAAARPPHDQSYSYLQTARASALAVLGELDGAAHAYRSALEWGPSKSPTTDMALGVALWIERAAGGRIDPMLIATAAEESRGRYGGWADNVHIALACCDPGPLDERGRMLARLAQHRPLGRYVHEEAKYVVAYALLNLERGDTDRAGQLMSVALPVGGFPVLVSFAQVLIQLHGWPRGAEERNGVFLPYFSEDQAVRAATAPRVLAEELTRWER